ncbi:phosphotransferase [Nucisporomicrobium flavum]|uniref:phosphotransferase n=1 Tax=Nucisporomicrobium flavum TaxID=2785915 RepID=UPI0018F401DE|nr:phosphotransferase [Nucisporomicrobium flavum]
MNPPADLVGRQWESELLAHNPLNGATGGVWRVNGDGRTVILKIVTPPGRDGVPAHWATSADPGHWNYWRREALAYRDGLASTAFAAAGIRAPALAEWTERPDGSIALWLEHVSGIPGTAATPTMLGDFAERLGAGHAAWLGRRHRASWLSRDWLRDYTTTRPVTAPVAWEHPTAAAAWPAGLRAGLRDLWVRRHDLLRATDELPRTLCHHDVWPTNVIIDGSGPVLLDWSFVGPGPLGEDAANLILDTFFDGLVDLALLDEVVERVTTGYLRGLAGVVDAATVRRAIRLTGAAKYFWLAPFMINRLTAPPADARRTYDVRDPIAVFTGRRRPLELVEAWYRETR